MSATQQISPLDRLAILASQRTARTDRLAEAVSALLSLLSPHVEVGASVTVQGYELGKYYARTKVGAVEHWTLSYRDADYGNPVSCAIDMPVKSEGYFLGDFDCPWKGPLREELISFAARAGEFVEALIIREEKGAQALESALLGIESATARARS